MTAETIYLDHSATTPLRPEVLEAMLPYLREQFGNAGSVHRFGRRARKAVDDARDQVAALINADPRDIYFTSGGTEADNLALRGIAAAHPNPNAAVIVSALEHHAVLHAAEYLQRMNGAQLHVLPVDENGLVDLAAFESALDSDVAVVSVMHGNNETGVIEPIETIGNLCRERGIPFHSDAVQTAGKVPIDITSLPVDMLAMSAHKLYGPKGVGAFYARNDLVFEPQALGGAQERGRRAGTENVAGIVGFGKACELALAEMVAESKRLEALRQRLEAGLFERIEGVSINGREAPRLPHILNAAFEGVEGESVLLGLDMEGIAVSTGSACTAGSLDPSHVLIAMGLDHERALSAIRFSFGRSNSDAQVDQALEITTELIARLRAASPLSPQS